MHLPGIVVTLALQLINVNSYLRDVLTAR